MTTSTTTDEQSTGYQVDEHPRRFGVRTDEPSELYTRWHETIGHPRFEMREAAALTPPLSMALSYKALAEKIEEHVPDDSREDVLRAVRRLQHATRTFEQLYSVAVAEGRSDGDAWMAAVDGVDRNLVMLPGSGRFGDVTSEDADAARAWWREHGIAGV